ncbi:hypothetical protein CFC21_021178 [Triticum aestivum]|uniref:NB-ARC domain-containing protein n=3 Tax=Triticum TaxID=4564 RepID=A0A9R1PCQ9_TRITD|nr:putative disease resistance protein RGA4 [Triticum aestivum]KAF7006113.1 hypothetical protein CFC21_021178 [Triticum aestivum]VAH41006.1 unnamed protein product [Triticum turgidum subsp. durum]
MAQVIVQRSCMKLRSAMTGDKFTSDLKEMVVVLEGVQPLIEAAERQSVPGRLAWYWLRRVRKTAYDIFDMVEELRANSPPPAATVKMRIEVIKKELEEIRLESCIFKQARDSSIQQAIHVPAEGTTADFDGARDAEKQMVMDKLSAAMSGITQSGQEVPLIFPIFGPPGIGKTTMAKLVFSDDKFREHLRAWIDVSQEFSLCKIGKSIISQVSSPRVEDIGPGGGGASSNETECMSMSMTKHLHQELLLHSGRKDLLVVLDDQWEDDPTQLESLRRMLTVGDEQGSIKVTVIVTCDQGIARKFCTTGVEPYMLNPLSQHMCWTIIKRESCFKVRHGPEKKVWEQIGREIASKCGGVPLTARVLGATLRGRDVAGWREVSRQQSAVMYVSPAALELGFRRMPPNLKLCLAYAAIFAKGHTIVKHDLIHQWIALHLIDGPPDNVSTAKRAEEYIMRLMDISFLQPAKSASASGKDEEANDVMPLTQASAKDGKGATLFTMPDNVHDFVKSVMGDELIANVGLHDINEFCRYALLTDLVIKRLKYSTLPAQLRALRCVGCSKMELSDDTFSFARCLRVLELKESSMQKLPDSICQLRHLGYLNLSGCSGLVTLPESFGVLLNLFHVNLSGCCGLSKLPESFRRLKRLVHLDLSFSSCFQGIEGILGALINIQHLNLSNPSCYLPEHRPHLQGLKLVICKLTKLVYLNLSMFLNPIFCYMSQEEQREYIGTCISGLSSLEHLDLSHNIFLRHLPENLDDLNKLHTLDLSGCIRLFPMFSVIKRAGILNSLSLLVVRKCRSLFVVLTDDGAHNNNNNNLVQLDDGAHNNNNLVQLEGGDCKELEIVCLEKIKSAEEARRIKLADKGRLRMLNMHWTLGCHGAVEQSNDILGELVPPHNLQRLELHGYIGTCFPPWILRMSSHLPNLVEVTMEDIPNCRFLPPLGSLPKLKHLVLRRMPGIIRIDAAEQVSGDTEVFHQLSKFTIDDMQSLQELNTTCSIDDDDDDDDDESMPHIDELVIRKCSKLSFGTLLPRARRLHISDCDQLMVTVLVECPFTPITELVVESCEVPIDDWSLLCHLDGLQTLSFFHCHNMTELPNDLGGLLSLRELNIVSCKNLKHIPDSMQHLTSLQSIHFSDCESITGLPDWFKRLTSLQILVIRRCHAIESLPVGIQELSNLKDPLISDCPKLEQWRESKEKEKLADNRPVHTRSMKRMVADVRNKVGQANTGTDQ